MGKFLLGTVALVVLSLFCFFNLQHCFMSDYPRNRDILRTRAMMKDLKISFEAFEIEYEEYPIALAVGKNEDSALRSRGPMLNELSLFDGAKHNFKKIKFLDLPAAKDRKYGLWQDGDEWVLSDLWGEPYYIILDTNGDNMIANPEFGADQSDPDYAKRCRSSPPPPTLPSRVIIYSSGPDRDPKTWSDNICSWR
jgi:hypothetical protein